MEDFSTTDAGIIFIGIILVLREVFAFVIKKRNGKHEYECIECIKKIKSISKQTDDLHRWHDVRDDEGIPVWHIRKSLEKAIIKLADNVKEQTIAIQEQSAVLERIDRPEFKGD